MKKTELLDLGGNIPQTRGVKKADEGRAKKGDDSNKFKAAEPEKVTSVPSQGDPRQGSGCMKNT